MLLDPHRKKMATIIVGNIGTAPKRVHEDFVQRIGEDSKGREYETPDDDDESMMGIEAAMEEFSNALSDKDFKRAARAFQNAMYMCDMGDMPEGSSED